LSIKDFYAVAYTRNEKMFAGLGGSSVSPSKHFTAYNLNLEGDISKDTLNFNLIWNNFKDTANYSADISGTVTVKKKINDKNEYTCNFKQSELIINDIPWNFDNAKIKTDTSHINISNLKIKHKDEEIYLDGNISRYRGDFLFLKIRNLDMNNFRPLFSEEINIKGKLNGISTIANLYDRPLIFTKDSVSNLTVNNMNFGNLYIKSYWDDAKNTIHANAYNLKGKRRIMNDSIYGDYNPENKTLNFTADIRSMLLKTFKDYYKDLVEFNNSAFLSGIINLKGNVKNPEITGNIKIKQTTAYVKYLNTFNTINEMNLIFDRNNIIVNKTKMLPKNGNGFAYISGNIRHKNFSNFSLNIDINTQNYEILDIIPADSAYYYGRAFATGNINFSGPFNNIFMDANLTTNKNTDIFIPISSDRIYTKETNFLTFKTDTIIKTKNKKNKPSPADINGFEMNMKLDITPDAEIQILPEENTGDIYTKGSGGLNLTLNKSGDFNVFGTYVISKGNYIFNIENIIRKNFKIQDGSTIEWFGKPQNARVNINAVYTLYNIALSDLTQDPEERTRTKVDCIIEITGKLLNPDFKLKVVLPETLTEYTAKLNSLAENEMNEQFLSLLLLSNFQALPGIRQDNIGGDQVTGEILSKQLNSLLRKIKYVDVNVDYRLGNAQYSDEYKIGVKKSFLNDRIEVSGNLGIGGKETQNTDANNYIGEFEVEAKLNPKGTVRAKVYNKANDRIENDGDYTQGIGFIWRRDFDNFFDFLHFKNKKDTAKFSPPDVKNKKNRKEK
ncbi:MAG: hypothetical protein GXO50_05185, partial [Chlorobi bacterium]|nr:hypothetical protein [Chlorobiota bacterium]